MNFGKLWCVLSVLLAALAAVQGSGPLLARPPLAQAASGFIANESPATAPSSSSSSSVSGNAKSAATPQPPSFVSVGIRSGCAREKAATANTLRNKNVVGTSAASRLRGGSSWIPHPPAKLSRADLEHSHANYISSTDPVSLHRPTESSSCNSRSSPAGGGGGGGSGGSADASPSSSHPHAAEFTVSKQRMMADERPMDASTFEDENEGAGAVGGGGGFAGGGGGGGGGGKVGTPSIPRALKKFAWVP